VHVLTVGQSDLKLLGDHFVEFIGRTLLREGKGIEREAIAIGNLLAIEGEVGECNGTCFANMHDRLVSPVVFN